MTERPFSFICVMTCYETNVMEVFYALVRYIIIFTHLEVDPRNCVILCVINISDLVYFLCPKLNDRAFMRILFRIIFFRQNKNSIELLDIDTIMVPWYPWED